MFTFKGNRLYYEKVKLLVRYHTENSVCNLSSISNNLSEFNNNTSCLSYIGIQLYRPKKLYSNKELLHELCTRDPNSLFQNFFIF